MKKLLALSFLVITLLNLFAQKQKASFEIGSTKIFFTLEEKGGSQGNGEAKIVYAKFLNDSACVFKKPVACYSYDTMVQINPVSLEEETNIIVDSTGATKFNLGSVSKTDLAQAIASQLGLDKSEFDCKLKGLTAYLFGNHFDSLTIDYANPATIEPAKQKIQKLSNGSIVLIGKVDFENTDARSIYGEFENIAVMKIKE